MSELVREGTPELKMQMEELLGGNCIEVALDEQVIFEQLKKAKGAIWSLLLASGYLKPVSSWFNPEEGKSVYQLRVTNHETMLMFRNMIEGWFSEDSTSYSNFKKALVQGDLNYMNRFMNDVAKVMFSSFDSGNKPSEEAQPERLPTGKATTKGLKRPNPSVCFYHGFVLGLVVDLSDKYHIRSNRESGFGRYDVIMEPRKSGNDAMIMEFKVFDEYREKTLEDTAQNALRQIREKEYDTELEARGIPQERIRHYGFAFKGKKVLIRTDK